MGDSENKNIREVPAVGLKIQVRSYTKYENDVNKDIIGQTYTDKNGETGPICTATGPIFYDILYQDTRWQLHNGNKPNDNLVVQGVIPHLLKMTYNFYDGHHFGSFAAITRALHAYYYENYNLAAGLGKPIKQINVGVCPDPYGFAFGNTYTGRFIPALDGIECPMLVFAGQKNTTREKPTRELMEITFHELGHASHNNVQESNYHSRGDEKDGESWANGVEYIYMKSYFGDSYSSSIGGSSYTDLVECLLKNGFSLAQIQSGFASSRSWDTWKAKMIEQNSNIPNSEIIINTIFDNPNSIKYDLRKFVVANNSTYYKNEVGNISFINTKENCEKSAKELFTIDDIQFMEADGVALSCSKMDYNRPFIFSKSGRKTINVHIKELNIWYPIKITVIESDLFNIPEFNGIKNYTSEYNVSPLLTNSDNGRNIYADIQNWKTPESDGKLISTNNNYASFNFSSPGQKRISFDVLYEFSDINILRGYERTVNIDDLDSRFCSFTLISPPARFVPGETYYATCGHPTAEISHILVFNHYNYGLVPYHREESWSYDKNTGILKFKCPSMDNSILSFTLRISFGSVYSGYDLLVSNYLAETMDRL